MVRFFFASLQSPPPLFVMRYSAFLPASSPITLPSSRALIRPDPPSSRALIRPHPSPPLCPFSALVPAQLLQEAHDIGESLQKKVESLDEVERAFVHLDFETSHDPTSEHKQWGGTITS